MSAPLTRKDLDTATCGRPGCDHTAHDGLFLHGRCHPRAAVQLEYKPAGFLQVTCAVCRAPIIAIAVHP